MMKQPQKNPDLEHFIHCIMAAIANTQLFFVDHPQVTFQLDKALADCSSLTRLTSKITLARFETVLIYNGIPVNDQSPGVNRFLELLDGNRIESITFLKGLPKKELKQFIRAIASRNKKRLRSTRHITFGKIVAKDNEPPGTGQNNYGPDDSSDSGSQSRHNVIIIEPEQENISGIDQIREIYTDLKTNKKQYQIDSLKKAVQLFVKGIKHSIQPLQYLATIKSYDEYTFVHGVNVFVLTMSLAEFIGFKGIQLYDIGVASLLHDVGKLFISDDILNKTGSLTHEERKIIQSHSIRGSRYLMGVDGITRLASISAMDHHIRFDGTGYPVIRNWQPNIVSQMISISDAFDAMRSDKLFQFFFWETF